MADTTPGTSGGCGEGYEVRILARLAGSLDDAENNMDYRQAVMVPRKSEQKHPSRFSGSRVYFFFS